MFGFASKSKKVLVLLISAFLCLSFVFAEGYFTGGVDLGFVSYRESDTYKRLGIQLGYKGYSHFGNEYETLHFTLLTGVDGAFVFSENNSKQTGHLNLGFMIMPGLAFSPSETFSLHANVGVRYDRIGYRSEDGQSATISGWDKLLSTISITTLGNYPVRAIEVAADIGISSLVFNAFRFTAGAVFGYPIKQIGNAYYNQKFIIQPYIGFGSSY